MIGDRRRQKFTLLPLKGGRGGAKSPVARKDMRTVRERETDKHEALFDLSRQ